MSRIMAWIERDNARAEAKLANCSVRWLIARMLFGGALLAKGGFMLARTPEGMQYLIGPLLMLGGLAFIVESVDALMKRAKRSA